jgi:hypothetical protein
MPQAVGPTVDAWAHQPGCLTGAAKFSPQCRRRSLGITLDESARSTPAAAPSRGDPHHPCSPVRPRTFLTCSPRCCWPCERRAMPASRSHNPPGAPPSCRSTRCRCPHHPTGLRSASVSPSPCPMHRHAPCPCEASLQRPSSYPARKDSDNSHPAGSVCSTDPVSSTTPLVTDPPDVDPRCFAAWVKS